MCYCIGFSLEVFGIPLTLGFVSVFWNIQFLCKQHSSSGALMLFLFKPNLKVFVFDPRETLG